MGSHQISEIVTRVLESDSDYFPLSASWRKAENRKFDWTTRVLALLAKSDH